MQRSRGRRPVRWWLLRSEEHTSELQSRLHLVCRLLLEKKKKQNVHIPTTTLSYARSSSSLHSSAISRYSAPLLAVTLRCHGGSVITALSLKCPNTVLL